MVRLQEKTFVYQTRGIRVENTTQNCDTVAANNGTAAASVGVGLSARSAIVVGHAPLRARHTVPAQCTIAYVPGMDYWVPERMRQEPVNSWKVKLGLLVMWARM